jgi:hypothetical protein
LFSESNWRKYLEHGRLSSTSVAAKLETLPQIDREAEFERNMGNQVAQGILRKVEIYAVAADLSERKIAFDIVVHDSYKRGREMRLLLRQPTDVQQLHRADFKYIRVKLPDNAQHCERGGEPLNGYCGQLFSDARSKGVSFRPDLSSRRTKSGGFDRPLSPDNACAAVSHQRSYFGLVYRSGARRV